MAQSKHKVLKTLISAENPSIMMIQETKCPSEILKKNYTKCWCGFQSIAVDVDGASVGLEILWNPFEFTLSHFFTTHPSISTKFQPMGSNQAGFITNVYGPQILPKKLEFLQLLDPLKPSFP
jgi:hypothetical protein